MPKRPPNPHGAGAYLVRETAELALLLAALAIAASLADVPSWLLVGLPLGKVTASVGFYALFLRKVLRSPARPGTENMVGRVAVAATPLNPTGQAKIDGELWSARSADGSPITQHEEVEILAIRGNTLLVSRSIRDGCVTN